MSDYYYKGRLMIEYLMDIKHLSYDQILKDSVSESTIFKEMINGLMVLKVLSNVPVSSAEQAMK